MHIIFFLSALIAVGSSATTRPILSSGCVHEGKTYVAGQTFQTSPCVHCTCVAGGQVMCLASACRAPQCVDYTHDPNQCCPTCPNGENCRHSDGTVVKKGEVYHPDSTTTCMCPENNFGITSTATICAVQLTAPSHVIVDPVHTG